MKEAEELKKKGNEAYNCNQYKEAIELYKQALSISHNYQFNAILYSNMANSYFQMEKYEEALKLATNGCKLDASNLKPFYWRSMSLWKLGKLNEALDIIEGLLKKDINNPSFKQLANYLIKAHKQDNIKTTIEDIKISIESLNHKKLITIIERNIGDIKEILIDSYIVKNLIEKIWNERKNIKEVLIEILISLLEMSGRVKLEIVSSTELSMISDILTTYPKYISNFIHKYLIPINIHLDIQLLEFINTLLLIPNLTNDHFISICDLLLFKVNDKIEVLLIQRFLQSFLDKFNELLAEHKDLHKLYIQCMHRIAVFLNEISNKPLIIEYLKENILFINSNMQIKSLIACEILARLNTQTCVDYLASKDYLVLVLKINRQK